MDGQKVNRYRGPDRRRKPTNPFSLTSLFGSRRGPRREEDSHVHYYVDRYDLTSALLFAGAMVLSTVDLIFTLQLVGSGGKELNPIMDFFLSHGPYPFLLAKLGLTAAGLFFMLLHKEYRWRRGSIRGVHFLGVILTLYLALIVWEFILLRRL